MMTIIIARANVIECRGGVLAILIRRKRARAVSEINPRRRVVRFADDGKLLSV